MDFALTNNNSSQEESMMVTTGGFAKSKRRSTLDLLNSVIALENSIRNNIDTSSSSHNVNASFECFEANTLSSSNAGRSRRGSLALLAESIFGTSTCNGSTFQEYGEISSFPGHINMEMPTVNFPQNVTAASNNDVAVARRRATLDLLDSKFGKVEDNQQNWDCPLDCHPFNDPFESKTSNHLIQDLQKEVEIQFRNQVQQQKEQDCALQTVIAAGGDHDTSKLEKVMEESTKSQQTLHDWDKFQMGLKKSHSKTMRLSRKSRKKILSTYKKERTQKAKYLKRMERKQRKAANAATNNAAKLPKFPHAEISPVVEEPSKNFKSINSIPSFNSMSSLPMLLQGIPRAA